LLVAASLGLKIFLPTHTKSQFSKPKIHDTATGLFKDAPLDRKERRFLIKHKGFSSFGAENKAKMFDSHLFFKHLQTHATDQAIPRGIHPAPFGLGHRNPISRPLGQKNRHTPLG